VNRQFRVAVLALTLVLFGCIDRNTTPAARETSNYQLIEKSVTIDGELTRAISPQVFMLQSDDREILIVNAKDIPFRQGTLTRVTGTLQKMTIADIEKEYDVDSDELGEESEQQPIIIADRIALSPSLQTLTTRTNWFLGSIVTVRAEVVRVLSENAYTIDNDDVLGEENLLVVSSNPVKNLQKGDIVRVTGSFSQVNRGELEDKFNLDAAEVYKIYPPNQPVIVAQTTQTSIDDR
jgi:hypothetical protein